MKIHLASDPRCRPMVSKLSPGQAGDAPRFPLVVAALRVARPTGRPRTRPDQAFADKTPHASIGQAASIAL